MAGTVLDELITIIGFRGDTRELDRVQQRVRQIESNINTMVRNFAIAGAALTGVGFVVGRTILSFDRAMNTLRATFLEAPTDELADLEQQAKDLGATTSKSATDAANAQVELARAGLSTKQVMEAIPDVLNLAIAGELEMAEAAGLVTSQLAAFKFETSETERVVDVLAKTAVSAKTTVAELGPAFRQVAPLAADLGISIEQTAAIIGTLRSGGLIPEQTGTAFKNIIAILQEDPTDNVREGFRRLNLDFEEVSAMVSSGDIEGAFKRIGDAGLDTKTALQIFGREAAVGASILAGSVTGVEDFIAELEAAGGTADEMREILESGFPGSVNQFKSALEGLQLSLADSGLRALMTNALIVLRELINAISNAPGPIKTLIVAVIAAGPGLLALSFGLKALAIAFRPLTTAIRTSVRLVTHWRASLRLLRMRVSRVTRSLRSFATAIWSRVSPALTALGRGVRAAGIAMLKFARAPVAGMVAGLRAVGLAMWGLVANPVGAAIAVIALAIVAAAVIIRKYWEPIKAFFIGMGNGLQEALQPIKEAFGEVIAALEPLQPVLSAIGDAFGWVGDIIGKVVGWFTKLLDPVDETSRSVKQAGDAGRTTGKIIGTVLLLPIKLIIGYFKLWIMIIRTLITVFTWLRDTVGKVISTIKAVWNWAKGNWPLLVGILLGPFGIVGALIWKFRDQILGAFREVWDWLRDSPIFGPVIDGIQAIIDFVRELPGRVLGILKDIPGMVADAIRDIPGLGAALEAFTGISDKVGGFFGKVKERFAQGGIVPGPLGRPLLATVHGGEMVLPVGASKVLAQMLEGFRLGPAALPQAPYHYGQMYRSSVVNRSVTVNMNEPIVIQTQATDAKGIAQELREEIEDQIRNIAYDHDGPVER